MATETIGAVITRKGRCSEDGYSEPVALLDDGREMPMGWNLWGPVYDVGTRGTATFISTETAGLWRFEPETRFISDSELDALNRARRVLNRIQKRADDLAYEARNARAPDPDGRAYSRVSLLAEQAEDAIFDVLNQSGNRIQEIPEEHVLIDLAADEP